MRGLGDDRTLGEDGRDILVDIGWRLLTRAAEHKMENNEGIFSHTISGESLSAYTYEGRLPDIDSVWTASWHASKTEDSPETSSTGLSLYPSVSSDEVHPTADQN